VEIASVADHNELSDDLEGDQIDYSDSDSDSRKEVCEEGANEDRDSEEEDVSSQSEFSFSSDADDESSDAGADIDEGSSSEYVDEERVVFEEGAGFLLVSGDNTDEESVSADEIQNLIEKPESSDMVSAGVRLMQYRTQINRFDLVSSFDTSFVIPFTVFL
jgi:hypothetical protein